MRITVHAKTGARRPDVREEADGSFTVAVSERPEAGKANRAILRALAEHLEIAPSRLMIVSGQTAKEKIIELE